MSDKVFLDTNVLVYCYSNSEIDKQLVARKLIAQNTSYISTQVLQELANTFLKKFKINAADTLEALYECSNNNIVHLNNESNIKSACEILDRYGYTFYDSLILAAALDCGCATLFSEDFSHEQIINHKLKIVNPFKV